MSLLGAAATVTAGASGPVRCGALGLVSRRDAPLGRAAQQRHPRHPALGDRCRTSCPVHHRGRARSRAVRQSRPGQSACRLAGARPGFAAVPLRAARGCRGQRARGRSPAHVRARDHTIANRSPVLDRGHRLALAVCQTCRPSRTALGDRSPCGVLAGAVSALAGPRHEDGLREPGHDSEPTVGRLTSRDLAPNARSDRAAPPAGLRMEPDEVRRLGAHDLALWNGAPLAIVIVGFAARWLARAGFRLRGAPAAFAYWLVLLSLAHSMVEFHSIFSTSWFPSRRRSGSSRTTSPSVVSFGRRSPQDRRFGSLLPR